MADNKASAEHTEGAFAVDPGALLGVRAGGTGADAGPGQETTTRD